jgi:predicted kinase
MAAGAVLFCGLQAAGKSTFYRERFSESHAHINLDTLRTRSREAAFLRECIAAGRSFVVDNTNLTAVTRARYIVPARDSGYIVIGYYFRSAVGECLARNAQRPAEQRVPDIAIRGSARRLERPTLAEGFDHLYHVRIGPDGAFIVEEWQDEM